MPLYYILFKYRHFGRHHGRAPPRVPLINDYIVDAFSHSFSFLSTIQAPCFRSFSMPLTTSPAKFAFSHVQWDRLNSLRLTAQETALFLRIRVNESH